MCERKAFLKGNRWYFIQYLFLITNRKSTKSRIGFFNFRYVDYHEIFNIHVRLIPFAVCVDVDIAVIQFISNSELIYVGICIFNVRVNGSGKARAGTMKEI